MNTLSSDEQGELLDREDISVFPSVYALSAYETNLNASAYDLLVQAFYNL